MSWRDRAVAAALADLTLRIVESDPAGADWIDRNIIEPVWGPKASVKDTQYCGDTLARWWYWAGMKSRKGLSSPGKVRYQFADRDKRGTVYGAISALPGDAVLHQLPAPQHWRGHVMMCLAKSATHILVAEGNHGCSMGPSLKSYAPGKNGEDLTRRQGIGIRWLRLDDPYIKCVVSPNDSEFGE
jgi:hypothetical protein